MPEKRRGPVAQKIINAAWGELFKLFGLEDVEIRERFTRLLVLHFMLDHGVTGLLAWSCFNPRFMHDTKSFKAIEATVARLEMARRIDLAEAAQLVPASC